MYQEQSYPFPSVNNVAQAIVIIKIILFLLTLLWCYIAADTSAAMKKIVWSGWKKKILVNISGK
jgi:hypothetical protein